MTPTDPAQDPRDNDRLREQLGYLEAEVTDLRRRLAEAPGHSRSLEQRLVDTQRSLAGVTSQNERLAQTLREARDQIMTLKEEVDRLAQPPTGFGTFLHRNDDDSIDVFTGGRKLRVNAEPRRRPRRPAARPGGHAQRGPQRRRRPRVREGRRGGHVQGAARRLRAGPGHRERRRGARRAPGGAAAATSRSARGSRCCSTRARAPRGLLREGAQVRGRGAGARGGPRHRLLRHRRAGRPDRGRSATPWSCPTCTRSSSSSTS